MELRARLAKLPVARFAPWQGTTRDRRRCRSSPRGAVAILAAPLAVSQGAVATRKLCPTGLGENAKRVEPALFDHVPQLGEGHVWPQIRIDNRSGGLVGAFDDLRRGDDAHSADFRVNPDQGRE